MSRRTWSGRCKSSVCECADESCVEPIAMTMLEYEALRRDGKKFAVAPFDLHVFLDIERVVREHERFWIVEKFDESGRVAADLNPRVGSGRRLE